MRRLPCLTLALALACAEIGTGVARAQGVTTDADVEPPVIELEALGEAAAAASQVFTAQVVDDRSLRDVVLYHRRAGDGPFERAVMRPLGVSAFHSVALATDPADLRDIEYYVQARDVGGNRSVEGFAFEPIVRRILPAPAVAGSLASREGAGERRAPDASERRAGPAEPAPSIGSKVRWWHVALGVVAVGSLAALAGGGDDGGSGSDAPSGPTVPLTVNLGVPGR